MQPKSKPDKNVNVVIVWTKLNSCFYVNGGVESLFNHTVYLLIKICSFIDYQRVFTYFLGYWWFYYSRQLILLNKADDCRYWSTKLFNIFVKHFINFRGNNDVSTISKPVICNFYIFILIESTFYSTLYFRKKGHILFVFLVFFFFF